MNKIFSGEEVTLRSELVSLLIIALLVGCTKTVPPKEVAKLETTDKNSVSLGADYLMAASQGQGSRTSPDSFPYFFGENKRVQLRFTKTSLIIEEKEKDARFQGNSTNDKTVFEIPIEHLDYRCAENRFGECTGQEEVNSDVSWEQKKYFKLKDESFKAAQIEALPMAGDPCYEEVSSRIVGTPEISPENINFEIEKSFVQSCSARDLSETNVKARYHYSLVRVDTVLTPGFKAVNYPEKDQSKFGFFSTERYDRDTDLNETESGKVTLMNHWSPDRERLDFYLSDEFGKPENALVKALTYKTVANLNLGLSKSGAKFKMYLHEPDGKNPGDIRNSMIVLVEDPLASSIIGYGPQTEDPKTGEIISARTTMFLGTIKAFIKYTYEDIRRAKRAKALEKLTQESAATTPAPSQGDSNNGADQASLQNKMHLEFVEALTANRKEILSSNRTSSSENYVEKVISSSRTITPVTPSKTAETSDLKLSQMTKLAIDPKMERDQAIQAQAVGNDDANTIPNYVDEDDLTNAKLSTTKKTALQKLNYLNNVKNCAFSPPYGMISHSFELKLADLLPGGLEELKPWEKLSASEKEKVIEVLLPDVWVATLIHELGHNLGLRHNFEASEDSVNSYSSAQIQALNTEVGEGGYAQQNLAYANSVMEYIDDLKALKHFGFYDIEALKFAYNKVGYEQDLGTENERKDLKFCTDEAVGVNAGCRRHDVGTSYVEIVNNLIKGYYEAYEYRNFRRDRADFSLFGDVVYASRIGQIFFEIRLMLETSERIANRYYPYTDPKWKSIDFLADLRAATKIGGEFFLQVISTGDKTCYFKSEDPATRGLIPVPLRDLRLTTCESIDPNDFKPLKGYHLFAQSGRLFNSMKDPESPNNFADQVDVRGYWIDQMLALRYLLYRQVGVSLVDAEGDNYMDLPELREPILKTLTDLALNKLVAPTEIQFVDGSKMTLDLPIDSVDSRRVDKPIHPFLARRLGVPNRPFYLTEYFNQFTAHQLTLFTDKENLEKTTAEIFKVASFDNRILQPKVGGTLNQKYLDVGTQRFVAAPENAIALELFHSAEEFRSEIQSVKSLGPEVIKAALEILSTPVMLLFSEDQKITILDRLASQLKLSPAKRKNLLHLAGMLPAVITDLAEKSESDLLNQDSSVQLLRMLREVN